MKKTCNILHIGITCAQGSSRPDSYIENALKIFGLKNMSETGSKLIGVWKWQILCDITKEAYQEKAKAFYDYMKKLRDNGLILGAECFLSPGYECIKVICE